MIKSQNCWVKDIERQLNLHLEYDPESTVISIVPIKFGMFNMSGPMSDPPGMITTEVKIIWNSK